MTNQVSDERFERELSAFLARHADDVGAAPTAAEVAARLGSHAGARTFGLPVSPQLAWIVVAALLLLGVIGAGALGSLLLRSEAVVPPLTTTYEAVFVRWQAVDGSPRDPDLVVISVDINGREREIGHIRQVGMNHISGLFYPRAAVSTTGLLVYPRPIPDGHPFPWRFHWEILDLADTQTDADVVEGVDPDYDHLGAPPLWGPGERLAILWTERQQGRRLTFVDVRTGATTTVVAPEGRFVLTQWASDGSGVYIGNGGIGPSQLLRPDGSVAYLPVAVAPNGCGQFEEILDARLPCLAPDGSAVVLDHVRDSGPVEQDPFPRTWAVLTDSQSGASYEIEGAFAGFIEVTP